MLVKLENLWRQYVFPVVQNLAQLVYRLLSPLPEKARLPVSIISGSVLFYALMVVTNPKAKTFEPREQSWDVRAHNVVFGSTIPEFKSFGEVMAERNIFLRALVDGEVISVSDDLHEGAFIKKGEKLLTIDPFEYENALGEAKAQLISAEASLKMS
ncbi:MAG: biotin/lipoyl-binding protein, partial [Pseudomonadota bacterium]|nr:biotin/lipoyl-binding protein [Pseudomonadota bacterium]